VPEMDRIERAAEEAEGRMFDSAGSFLGHVKRGRARRPARSTSAT
jgi:hypothetical protein